MRINKKQSVKWVLFALVIWIIIIFLFSGQDKTRSFHSSDKIVDFIVQTLHLESVPYESVRFIVRKTAHFTEYCVLGAMLCCIFSLISKNKKRAAILSLVMACTGASIDEFHQIFVVGRTPLLSDVLIDSCGALLGIILFQLLFRCLQKKTAHSTIQSTKTKKDTDSFSIK